MMYALDRINFAIFQDSGVYRKSKDGRYLEAMTRAVGAGPSSRVECRWMKRKGLRKQSSQVTRMNSLLSFNKITDELMSSLKSGKPDISRILF